MSRLPNLVSFGIVVQTFLCLNFHLLVEIQEFVAGLCLSSDEVDCWMTFDIGSILYIVHSLGISDIIGFT